MGDESLRQGEWFTRLCLDDIVPCLTDVQAYRHTSPLLTSPNAKGSKSYPHHIVQISAGWSHSACLTSEGEIYYWFPISDSYNELLQLDQQPSNTTPAVLEDQASRNVECGKVGAGCVAPLETIPGNDEYNSGEIHNKSRKVVKIASGQDFLVALLDNGEVWFRAMREFRAGDWQFVCPLSSYTENRSAYIIAARLLGSVRHPHLRPVPDVDDLFAGDRSRDARACA